VALGKGSLATEQKYDVSVELDLPRSEQNLGVGNFMVEVTLLGVGWEGYESTKEGVVLASARRLAMLTYRSWLVEMAWRVTRLPWYLIGWRVESEKVGVKVLDGVQFEKGRRNTPESVRVEVRSGRGKVLQIYGVSVEFRTRFEGLRYVQSPLLHVYFRFCSETQPHSIDLGRREVKAWILLSLNSRYIMYNYRIISLLLFTALFWTVEMAFLLVTWGLFTLLFSRSTPPAQNQPKREIQASTAIKPDPEGTVESDATELESLSDASHTFPTYSRQPPLRYSAPRVKEEDSERALEDLPPRTPGDADDEDEEEDEDADFVLDETPGMGGVPSDSGLGTSMESGMESRGLLRRRSGGSVSGKRRE
jgi:hypothetical protein